MNRLHTMLTAVLAVAACDSTAPERALVVEGNATLDGGPVEGASVSLLGVERRRVADSSIRGYRYEEVESSLGSGTTGADGSYRIETTRPDGACMKRGRLRVTWGAVRAETPLRSQCGPYEGIDFRWTSLTVSGTLLLNGDPLGGATVVLREACPVFGCAPTVFDRATSRPDGSFEVVLVGCAWGDTYYVGGEIAERFSVWRELRGCSATRTVRIEASTLVEVEGRVWLDGAPASGWTGQIVGPAEACRPFRDDQCPETVLASAVTDADGRFSLSHLAEPHQCAGLYVRAVPPEGGVGATPVAVNPPATGWHRGCGPYRPRFEFESPS